MRLPQDRILHIDSEFAGDEVRVVAQWQGEVVRCKDCKHNEGGTCGYSEFNIEVDDYCSYGERREP